jgi:hypothetical protein
MQSQKTSSKTIYVVIGAVVILGAFALVVGLGVGLYFYFRKKTPPKKPLFGLLLKDPGNDAKKDDLITNLDAYKKAIIATYGPTGGLATKSQLVSAVQTDFYTSCFYGMVAGDLDNFYMAPFAATLSDYDSVNKSCGMLKDDVGKRPIYPYKYKNDDAVGANPATIATRPQGFYVYVTDQSKIPTNGDNVTINGVDFVVV